MNMWTKALHSVSGRKWAGFFLPGAGAVRVPIATKLVLSNERRQP